MTIWLGVGVVVAVNDDTSVVANGGTGVEEAGSRSVGLADGVTVKAGPEVNSATGVEVTDGARVGLANASVAVGLEVAEPVAVDEGDTTGVGTVVTLGDCVGRCGVEVGVLPLTIPVSGAARVTGAKTPLVAVTVTVTTIVSLSKDGSNALTHLPPIRFVPPRSRRATEH
jgi:hypothetical protein